MRRNPFLVGLLFSITSLAFLPPSLFSQEQPKPATEELRFNPVWAEKTFADVQTPMPPNNRLELVHEDTPGDTKKDLSSAGSKIRLGEKSYTRGLGVIPRSVLRVTLAQPAVRLVADIGMDRVADFADTAVRFLVDAGGTQVFASEVMKPGGDVRSIDVPLNGASAFDLIVEADPSRPGVRQNDIVPSADWANARVELRDGSQLWLDDLADQWDVGTDLPFSFTLDNQPSRELLSHWKREVQVTQIDASRRQRTLTLQDPDSGLEVRAVATIYTDTPGVDWTLYLSNHGSKDTPVIENLKALDVTVNPGVGTTPRLQRLRGSDAAVDDWQPLEDPIKPGQRIEFAPTNGRSSQKACPFFTVQYGGGGVITAIGWTGEWSASTERQADGGLRIQAGLRNLHLRLHPGESIRSPRIMQMYWFGGDCYRAYNLFRATMLSHIVPRIEGKTVVPPIVHLSTSFYEGNDSTESSIMSHLDSIRGLGFEMFWVDAYWTKGGFPAGMGNYGFPIQRVEPLDRLPHGLRPISDAVHRDGMGFVVWFEPERVHKGTYLAREHPEWVINLDKGDGSAWIADNGLFNLGLPAAREYMTRYLIAAIKAYGIDCLRIDFNIDPGPYWQHLDAEDPDRVGLAEIRYIEGLYKMWDDIRTAFPHLFIDNCASGGRRIDLETSSRSIPLWRTDGTITPLMALDFDQAALQNQVMTAGLSRYVPFSTSGQMGASPYLFRSGFNAGISFGQDVRPAGYPRDQLKQAIAEGKRLRKYYFGDFYPLNNVTTSPEDWCVLQYHRPVEQDGMVMAFRRNRSPYSIYELNLNEIDPHAKYEVTFYPTYHESNRSFKVGSDLNHLKIEIPDSPGSLLIEYKKVEP